MSKFSVRDLPALFLLFFAFWLILRFALPIAAPFLLAALLALAAEPLVCALSRYVHFPRGLSAAIGITIALALAIALIMALCALLIRELGALTELLPDLEDATASGLNALKSHLLSLSQNAPDGMRPVLVRSIEAIFSGSSALLDRLVTQLLNVATSLLRALPDSLLSFGTWMLASFMFSVRLPKIRLWLHGHTPAIWRERYAPCLLALKKTVCGWLAAQAKLVGITFGILSIGFLLIRIQHPILWAGVTCLVDILPVLGTGTVLIPWSLICFLQGNTLQALGLLAIYGMISLLRSALEPRLIGKQLGLDPLLTLLVIYAGYRLWGLPGMLFAPILAVLTRQIFLQSKK